MELQEQRSMSLERAKRGHHNDSEEEDISPPTKCHVSDHSQEPMPSTSNESTPEDDGFRQQGREYRIARKTKYEESRAARMMTTPTQPKETPTSRPHTGAIPRIIVPATEGFESPVDVAEAIETTLDI